MTVPEKVEVAANPFSKKRPIQEITPSKPIETKPVVELKSEDVEMKEPEETKQPVKEEAV